MADSPFFQGSDEEPTGDPEAKPGETPSGELEAKPSGLFNEPEADDGSGDFDKHPRFQKLITQRNEARVALEASERAIEDLKASQLTYQAMAEAVAKSYAGYDNPAAMIATDARFMNALEEAIKTDATVAQAVEVVKARMEGRPMEKDTTRTAPAAATEPARDGRVDKLIAQTARQNVTTALQGAGVQPQYMRLMTEHIVSRVKDPTEITQTEVMELGQGFIKEHGFTDQEILGASAKGTSKPATGAGGSKPAVRQAPAGDPEQKPEGAKSKQEWQANHDRMVAAFSEATPR